MMKIQLTNAGKRFNRDWIFRDINFTFLPQKSYAITGANGSGKSTLLQMLAGSISASEGSIEWQLDNTTLEADNAYQHFSIAAPYLELIEEMTATEFLNFHQQFKPLLANVSVKEIISIVGLEKAASKQIRYYSSGMKQRMKLAQAFFSDVPLLLLDEPCTNLDATGYELSYRLIQDYAKNKTIIVSSNDVNEYSFCGEVLDIMEYKSV